MADKPACKAILPNGGRCSAGAEEGQDWCYNHSPDRAEERKKNAAAGGHARSRRTPTEIEVLKEQVQTVNAAVLNGGIDKKKGTIDKHVAAVAFQGFNTMLRAIEIERKLDKQEELLERLAELEEEVARRGVTNNRWGTHPRIG